MFFRTMYPGSQLISLVSNPAVAAMPDASPTQLPQLPSSVLSLHAIDPATPLESFVGISYSSKHPDTAISLPWDASEIFDLNTPTFISYTKAPEMV
jgi:hypothetical protein